MAEFPVIFRIGAVGASLAGLQAGVAMVGALGRKVANAVANLEEFSQVYGKLEVNIAKADVASAGLVDTMEIMKGSAALSAANVKFTSDELAKATNVITKFAQATGKDATTAFKRLMEGISKGSTRTLKELGIDLENTEDLVLAQAEALEKVIALYDGMAVEVETLDEALYALNNNIDTSAGLIWDWASGLSGGTGALGAINEALGEFNNAMMVTDGAIADVVVSQTGLEMAMERQAIQILGTIGLLDNWEAKLREVDQAAVDLVKTQMEIAKKKEQATQLEYIAGQVAARDLNGAGVMDLIHQYGADEVAKALGRMSGEAAPEAPAAAARRGGGGRRKMQQEMVFTDEQVNGFDQYYRDDVNRRGLNATDADIDLMGGEVDPTLAGMGLTGLGGPTDETIQRSTEYWNLQTEILALQMEAHEKELAYAGEWSQAWITAYDGYTASSLLAKSSVEALRGATMAATNAVIFGGESASVAAKKALAAVAAQVAGESVFQALRETAAGFAAYARRDFEAAGEHWQSAGVWTATGIAAGAVAYGVNKSAGGGKPSAADTGGFGTGGYASGYGAMGGGRQQDTVKIEVDFVGGADGLFDIVYDANDDRKRTGQEAL